MLCITQKKRAASQGKTARLRFIMIFLAARRSRALTEHVYKDERADKKSGRAEGDGVHSADRNRVAEERNIAVDAA